MSSIAPSVVSYGVGEPTFADDWVPRFSHLGGQLSANWEAHLTFQQSVSSVDVTAGAVVDDILRIGEAALILSSKNRFGLTIIIESADLTVSGSVRVVLDAAWDANTQRNHVRQALQSAQRENSTTIRSRPTDAIHVVLQYGDGVELIKEAASLQLVLKRSAERHDLELRVGPETNLPHDAATQMFSVFVSCLQLSDVNDSALSRVLPASRSRFNETKRRFAGQPLLHKLVLSACAAYKNSTAIISRERSLSYAQLNNAIHHTAQRIMLKVPQRSIIAIVISHGWQQSVATAAVLSANCVYLPVNPADPRKSELIASAKLALTARGEFSSPTLSTLEIQDNCLNAADHIPLPEVDPDSAAYIIFTSGSEGKPKGVVISHRGAWNTIMDILERFGVSNSDAALALSALNFDLSVFDIFGMLGCGGRLVIPATSQPDPDEWNCCIREHGVTVWNSVPAKLGMLTELYPGSQSTLRVAMLSGDKCTLSFAQRLRKESPALILAVLGGATEASIWSNVHIIDGLECPALHLVPYGRPLSNQTMYVLDDRRHMRVDGVEGDICIGGVGVAMEYFGDPAKTAQNFFDHPTFGRLYLTGDIGYYLANGEIYICGRRDDQIKYRGIRVEPGEIERKSEAILGEGTFRVAVVLQPRFLTSEPSTCGDGDILRGYIQCNEESLWTNAVLLLSQKLPAQVPKDFVPQDWICVKSFPLTSNGKVDRKRLRPDTPSNPTPQPFTSSRPSLPSRGAITPSPVCTLKNFDSGIRLDDLIVNASSRHQDKIAVEHSDGRKWTYRQLLWDIDRVAALLANYGDARQRRIAMMLPPSYSAVVAVIACWRLGHVDVPMDMNFSEGRFRTVMEDNKPTMILVDGEAAQDVTEWCSGSNCRIVRYDDQSLLELVSTRAGALDRYVGVGGNDPSDLAYVSYTSGSTGKPKGVEKRHRDVVNSITYLAAEYGLTSSTEERILLMSPFSWEPFKRQLLLALACSHTLIIPSSKVLETQNMEMLAALIKRLRVTYINATPSLLRTLNYRATSSLRRVVFLGERLTQQQYDKIRGEGGFMGIIICEYGFTESAFVTAVKKLTTGDSVCDSTVGLPCRNVLCYVLDDTLQPCESGTKGLLYVGGIGVAQGYLKRDAETGKRFVRPNPFQSDAHAKEGVNETLYCTGDCAVQLPCGRIEYRGREDGQMKIQGVRTELGEVEAIANGCAGVEHAAAVVTPEGGELVCFYTGGVDPCRLMEHIRASSLLATQWPKKVLRVSTLPLNNNGKVDRLSLVEAATTEAHPLLTGRVRGAVVDSGNARSSNSVPVLRRVWCKVLGASKASLSDSSDFFTSGGDSFKASQLCSLLEGDGWVLSRRDVFRLRTFSLMSSALRRESPAKDVDDGRIVVLGGALDSAPVTPLQRTMLLGEMLNSRSMSYVNQTAMRYSGQNLTGQSYKAGWMTAVAQFPMLRAVFDTTAMRFVVLPSEDVPDHSWWREYRDVEAQPDFAVILAKRVQEVEREQLVVDVNARTVLFRVAYCQLSPTDAVAVITYHHLLLDGWSFSTVLDAVHAVFDDDRAFAGDDRRNTQHLYEAFQQYASRSESDTKCWLRTLQPLPLQPASPSRLHTTCTSGRESPTHELKFLIPSNVYHDLRHRAVSLYAVVQAALHIGLAKLLGHNVTSVGAVFSIREALGGYDVAPAGLTISTVPIQITEAGHHGGMQHIMDTVHQQTMEAMTHCAADFSEANDQLKPIDCLFVLENYPRCAPRSRRLMVKEKLFDVESVDMALAVLAAEELEGSGAGCLSVTLRYHTKVICESEVNYLAYVMTQSLRCFAAGREVAPSLPSEFGVLPCSENHPVAGSLTCSTGPSTPQESANSASSMRSLASTPSADSVLEAVLQTAAKHCSVPAETLSSSTFLTEITSSMTITKIVSSLRKIFGECVVKYTECFQLSLGQLSSRIAMDGSSAGVSSLSCSPSSAQASSSIVAVSGLATRRPTTEEERSILVADALAECPGLYHVEAILRLAPSAPSSCPQFDRIMISRWIIACVGRYESLRATRVSDDHSWVHIVSPEEGEPLCSVGEVHVNEDLSTMLDRFFVAPFCLYDDCKEHAIPIRAQILVVSTSGERIVQVVAHHAFVDGVSLQVLTSQLDHLIRNGSSRLPSPQPRCSVLPSTQAQANDKLNNEYWARMLCEYDTCDPGRFFPGAVSNDTVPIAKPCVARRSESQFLGRDLSFTMSCDEVTRLRRSCRGQTLFATLCSALGLVTHVFSGQNDFILGYASSLRRSNDGIDDDVVGMHTHVLPLRLLPKHFKKETRLIDFIRCIQMELHAANEHQPCSIKSLLQKANIKYSAVVSFLEAASVGEQLLQTGYSGHDSDSPRRSFAKFPVACFGAVRPGGDMEVVVTTSVADISRAWAESFVKTLKHVLATLAHAVDTDSVIAQLSWTASRNDASVAIPDTAHLTVNDMGPQVTTLLSLFMNVVRRSAIASEGGNVTFRELYCRVCRIAAVMRKKSSAQLRGTNVGVIMRKSPLLLTSLLAVLSNGAAYVPMDPSWCREKIDSIIDETNACMILVDSRGKALLRTSKEQKDASSEVVWVDASEESFQEQEKEASTMEELSEDVVQPNDLAYIIFTSGTTGTPKGVQVEHRTLVNLRQDILHRYMNGSVDNHPVLLLSNIIFDFSVEQLLLSIFSGNTCVLPSSDVYDIAYLTSQGVEFVSGTPTQLIHFDYSTFSTIRTIVVAGEPFREQHFNRIRRTYTGVLYNAYGITETTVYNTVKQLPCDVYSPSIGRPIAQCCVAIAAFNEQLAPLGSPGELWMYGDCLARGYCSEAETTKRFVIAPFTDRIYRSGDVVLMDANNGELYFVSRLDRQLKIRGHRIEPQEVENAAAAVVGVKGCAMIKRSNSHEDREEVILFVATGSGAEANRSSGLIESHVRDAVAKRLPHAVLSCLLFTVVDSIPQTDTGKINEAALMNAFERRRQQRTSPAQLALPSSEALTKVQGVIASIWVKLLDMSPSLSLKASSDFFLLGGHSQLVAMVRSRLCREFPSLSTRLKESEVMNCPLLSDLASLVEERLSLTTTDVGQPPVYVAAQEVGLRRTMPLLPIQRWCLERYQRSRWCMTFDVAVGDVVNDPEVLAKAWKQTLAAHTSFRVRLNRNTLGEWSQVFADHVTGELIFSDTVKEDTEFKRLQAQLDIVNGPVCCGCLYKLEGLLRFSVLHHVFDVRSATVFAEELYSACRNDSLRGSDVFAWQVGLSTLTQPTRSVIGAEDMTLWESLASKVPSFNARIKKMCIIRKHEKRCNMSFDTNADTLAKLRSLCSVLSTRIDDVIIAAVAMALGCHWSERMMFLTVESSGRPEHLPNAQETIGWLTTAFPVAVCSKSLIDAAVEVALYRRWLTRFAGVEYGHTFGYTNDTLPAVSFNYLGYQQSANGDVWTPEMIELDTDRADDHDSRNDSVVDVTVLERQSSGGRILSIHVSSALTDEQTKNIEALIAQRVYALAGEVLSTKTVSDSTSALAVPLTFELLSHPAADKDAPFLFLFPPGEGGLTSYINNLAKVPALVKKYRLVLLSNAYLDRGFPSAATFESLAKEYAWLLQRIRNHDSQPFLLGGWSFGGVLGLETAKQLAENAGASIKCVFLIDSYFNTRSVRNASTSKGLVVERINDDYVPSQSHFDCLKSQGTKVLFFKATEPHPVVRTAESDAAHAVTCDEEEFFYRTYRFTRANYLDMYLPSALVFPLHGATHYDWIKNPTLVEHIAEMISDSDC